MTAAGWVLCIVTIAGFSAWEIAYQRRRARLPLHLVSHPTRVESWSRRPSTVASDPSHSAVAMENQAQGSPRSSLADDETRTATFANCPMCDAQFVVDDDYTLICADCVGRGY